jgi:hypothetical protein
MAYRRCFLILLIVSVGVLIAVASPLAAQTCTNICTQPVTTSSPNNHYFINSCGNEGGTSIPLLGISFEYLCHISIPPTSPLAAQYCSLSNFQTIFYISQSNNNHLVRINTIFNSSPGVQLGNVNQSHQIVPFNDEQPYPWSYTNINTGTFAWDLSQIDTTFLNNLEAVICGAYQQNLVVEITLFDPWNPAWASSPFNPVNAKAGQGFSASRYFADTSADTMGSQNANTRAWQKAGVVQIVNRLKRYPNIIWEVANEPDLNPAAPIANVVAWEETVVSWIEGADTTHLIMVNGHTATTFAWNVAGSKVQTGHYHTIHISGDDGAIQSMRDSSIASFRQTWPFGFSENRSVPDTVPGHPTQINVRTVDDVRAEAWEFVVGGGGLFNAYSYNMTYGNHTDPTRDPTIVTTQLGYLAIFLINPMLAGGGESIDLATSQQASCDGGTDWCTGLPGWGTTETNRSPACAAVNVYWSTMQSANSHVLYIHHGELLSNVYGGSPQFDGAHEEPCSAGAGTGYTTPLKVRVQTSGCWSLVWLDPKSYVTLAQSYMQLTAGAPAVAAPIKPVYADDVAIALSYYAPTC